MAVLTSTGIAGFIASAKFTGKQIVNKAGELVPEVIEDFKPGFAGSGWKIWKRLGKWTLETDNIVVRGIMTVYELLIQKIRGVKGALAISQASGKVKNVRVVENFVYLEIEDEMYFTANDFVRCQNFSGTNQHFYHVEISEVVGGEIVIPITEFALDELYEIIDPPVIGDEIIQFGNSKDKTRQSVIYLHADEAGQPAIDLLFDVDSKDWSGKVKVSVGGEIPNSNGQRGFYSVNGLVKSVNEDGQTMYEFSPDGAVNIGNGSIVYNPDTKRLLFGKDVVLTWDNLSEDSKENLKGELGKPGIDGTPILFKGELSEPPLFPSDGWSYYNTIEKKSYVYQDGQWYVMSQDGVSLEFKGDLPEAPMSPENGWYYYNTVDKKSYVYQDGKWYVMTQDGVPGAPGTSILFQGDFPEAPINPKNGWSYYNTVDKKSYVYQDGQWFVMSKDGLNGIDGQDGLSIVWKGDLPAPPANPVKNWTYRDTDDGRVYIFNGTAWQLMVQDGSDGTDGSDGDNGLSVFITYHDSISEPEKPTGDGTANGWHTNATSDVYWISQKVALSASEGTWSIPMLIRGSNGLDGLNGSSYKNAYKSSQSKPPTPTGQVVPPPSWSINPTPPSDILHTWMTQAIRNGDGILGAWSEPIRISGENGINGTDGTDIEFIYKQTNTSTQPETPVSNDSIPQGWTDNPQGVSQSGMYEWICVRYKKETWGAYSVPVIWSKWGEKGMDGDGYEYIYILTSSNVSPSRPADVSQEEDFVPVGWSDDPRGVNSASPYEWTSTRKKKNGIWGEFSEPALWAKYGQDGLSIVWKGESLTPPREPRLNWAYRSLSDGRVYIYNGTSWQLMARDGNDGTDGTDGADGNNGLSVFITYHDSEIIPSTPTGDGTENGWHTDATENVYWMSQKVAMSPTDGVWGYPIKIRGSDSNLLPWVKDWNGRTVEIKGDHIVSPKIFSGRNTGTAQNPILTGVAMGSECIEIDGVKRTGFFGVVDNEPVFEIDPTTGRYVFKGTVYASDGEFEGNVKGISGSFKSLNCVNEKGKVMGSIEFGLDGKMWFSGDMYHQGYDYVNKRSYRFYTSDLWCRGEFGHWKMTTLGIDSNSSSDFYVFISGESVIDSPPNSIIGKDGQAIDCLSLKGSGDYVVRICESPKYKKITVVNETNFQKRIIINHDSSLTDTIGPYQFRNYLTAETKLDVPLRASITNLVKQAT